MAIIDYTPRARDLINKASDRCILFRHEFLMPEHLLAVMLEDFTFSSVISTYASIQLLEDKVEAFLRNTEQIPEGTETEMGLSVQMTKLINTALDHVVGSNADNIDVTHLTVAMTELEESFASYILNSQLGEEKDNFISSLITEYEEQDFEDLFGSNEDDETAKAESWRKLVVNMNETVDSHNPLIGREAELERTIQVLCRKDKNNPLHIGEPGVGKTALVYGLVSRIVEGNVPERLKNSVVYQLDLGTLLAGTQYRGDFENRMKMILDGVKNEGNAIIYMDEIHNIVGAGAIGESSMDAGNMLKPYLESGDIRFIGSTTYEEFNKYFSKSKGLVRRFQQIDITEPSIEETINILKQLKGKYEEFHKVVYTDEAIDYAVRATAKHISDRFLPDKAIDLIDEAGAKMEIMDEKTPINEGFLTDILAKMCKTEIMTVKENDNEHLFQLDNRMLAQIYGQDTAIQKVVEAVQMAKAGLTDDDKPLASLLFVGPTGVGKTEVARVLARELGIELVRFDMSEYTEKHTVAKLIGSPAGYVGYEDGGLLTDAIRKTPNCVLLLDEIEKAHSDIYNILLQVMDYARLTDNKGRKSDFRNVILIMTSNAGAQYATQASIGFNGHVSRGEAMLRQVKKTFKPEFINRLSGTVVFNDMDNAMALLILKKKLSQLQEKLTTKNVVMHLSDEAMSLLLKNGFTNEYGAREIDRVIAHELKPVLMREILFGKLKNGGNAYIDINEDKKIVMKEPVKKRTKKAPALATKK